MITEEAIVMAVDEAMIEVGVTDWVGAMNLIAKKLRIKNGNERMISYCIYDHIGLYTAGNLESLRDAFIAFGKEATARLGYTVAAVAAV